MSSGRRKVHDISDTDEEDTGIDSGVRSQSTSKTQTHSPDERSISSSSASSSFKRSPSKKVKNGLGKNIDIPKRKKLDFPSEAGDSKKNVLETIIKESRENDNRANLPSCRYGSMCYQTNEAHVSSFSHMNRELGFYLTKCEGLNSKYNADTFTRSLKEILHEDVGDTLESAVHFSYAYDMEWVLNQYPEQYRKLPMLLVAQQDDELLKLLIAQRQVYRNVFLLPIELARFGTHHTKMISLKYKNSLRIIVSTANLYEPDWSRKSQMVWVSPLLKRVDSRQGPDSLTGFRSSLCAYLRSYQKKKLTDLAESYADYDFSPIQSFFVGSTPHSTNSGLLHLTSILNKNVPPVSKDSPLTFCFSSIGSLGNDDEAWLRPVFGRRLLSSDSSATKTLKMNEITKSNIQPVYPTVEEVRRSLEGYEAGRSLPYSGKTHMRQRWLSQWFHHWKADRCGRSRASPHVKFYIRTSEDYEDTYWFLMSSANLSKAAWGNAEMKPPLAYECGILHVPRSPVRTKDLVVPFDLPPEKYSPSDKHWVQDSVYTAPDDYGKTWDPRKGGAIESL